MRFPPPIVSASCSVFNLSPFVAQLRSGEIHLVVSDLGRGFDLETAMQGRGLGLTSMQERLRLVGGELSINSQPKGGTTIHARVPFDSSSDSARVAG
jgi:signal transduction histidine kinase